MKRITVYDELTKVNFWDEFIYELHYDGQKETFFYVCPGKFNDHIFELLGINKPIEYACSLEKDYNQGLFPESKSLSNSKFLMTNLIVLACISGFADDVYIMNSRKLDERCALTLSRIGEPIGIPGTNSVILRRATECIKETPSSELVVKEPTKQPFSIKTFKKKKANIDFSF